MVTDVAFSGGKVARIGSGEVTQILTFEDVPGYIVAPGLQFDLPTHDTGVARPWGGCAMAVGYGMLVEQDTAVPMRDGAILRANVYRPEAHGRFPVLMTFGPYGKDVPLREFMQEAWDRLNKTYPEILAASSFKQLVFERPDPEMWVPDGTS